MADPRKNQNISENTNSSNQYQRRSAQTVFTAPPENPNQNQHNIPPLVTSSPPTNGNQQEMVEYLSNILYQMQISEMNFMREILSRVERLEAIAEQAERDGFLKPDPATPHRR